MSAATFSSYYIIRASWQEQIFFFYGNERKEVSQGIRNNIWAIWARVTPTYCTNTTLLISRAIQDSDFTSNNIYMII